MPSFALVEGPRGLVEGLNGTKAGSNTGVEGTNTTIDEVFLVATSSRAPSTSMPRFVPSPGHGGPRGPLATPGYALPAFEAKEQTMGVVPDSRLGKIEFYEAHITPWTTNAAAIGLTPASVTALGTLTTNARKAFDAAEAARQAAKSATQAYYDAVRAMHNGPGAGADMIDTIRNKAQSTNNPAVYTLAQIPPPATPGTTPPPGTPFGFTVGLLQDGSLELKWKCNNPSGTQGTIYEVKRQIGGGAFSFIGASGVKTFTDDTLSSGSTPATYQITAVRSTARGNPAQFTVNFGTGGPGLTIASVTEGGSIKMAA